MTRTLLAAGNALVAVAAGAMAVASPSAAAPPADPSGSIARVSVSLAGQSGNSDSLGRPAISADGRYVAFASYATDLVAGVSQSRGDIYVRDIRAGRTTLVSRTPGGATGNGESRWPSISADGRYVAFDSFASDLVRGDTNDTVDVFVRDLRRGRTVRVDVGRGGAQADLGGMYPDLSADGRHVAFESAATNLIAGDTNEAADIFVRDLAPGRTERVSLTTDGAQTTYYSQHASISADGSRVAFQTSPGLVPPLPPVFQDLAVCVRDRRRHTTVEASDGVSDPAFPVNSNVTPAISDNGRFVTFTFTGTRVIGADAISSVWVRDLRTGRLRLASPAADVDNPLAGSSASDLSGDGRLVVFASTDRLVPSDTDDLLDVYLRDLRTGGLRRVSAAGPVDPSTSGLGSTTPSIAGGGRHVAFYSDVAGLAPGGIPGRGDIYRYSSPAT